VLLLGMLLCVVIKEAKLGLAVIVSVSMQHSYCGAVTYSPVAVLHCIAFACCLIKHAGCGAAQYAPADCAWLD
jgi:hypothetical protein